MPPIEGLKCLISHMMTEQKDPEGDGYALQQLLLNFILEKQNQAKRFN